MFNSILKFEIPIYIFGIVVNIHFKNLSERSVLNYIIMQFTTKFCMFASISTSFVVARYFYP